MVSFRKAIALSAGKYGSDILELGALIQKNVNSLYDENDESVGVNLKMSTCESKMTFPVHAPIPKPEPPKPVVEDKVYTPESEFVLGSIGENYYIQKYTGSRSVVSIPPEIRGRKVVAIGPRAFSGPTFFHGNKSVENVTIPKTVTKIEQCAFFGCLHLKVVTAHEKIEYIDSGAFVMCKELEIMDFGTGNRKYRIVEFPQNLKEIGSNAFDIDTTGLGKCILNEVTLSKSTKVKNIPLQGKTFNPKYCAVFYYD